MAPMEPEKQDKRHGGAHQAEHGGDRTRSGACGFHAERSRYYVRRLIKGLTEVRKGRFNDINLRRWKEYDDIITDSLWIIDRRDTSGAHLAWYWGNFVPQIPHQLLLRYTRQGEWFPLGFYCMQEVLQRGPLLKSIVVKNFNDTTAKRGQKDLWRYRALTGGFYVCKHEYILLFQCRRPRRHARTG